MPCGNVVPRSLRNTINWPPIILRDESLPEIRGNKNQVRLCVWFGALLAASFSVDKPPGTKNAFLLAKLTVNLEYFSTNMMNIDFESHCLS